MTRNDEKKIYISFFEEKIKEGPISFLVLDSKYDTIHSKKRDEDFEIVTVTVEAKELDNPDSKKETITVNVFVDNQPGGFFHQFVVAALEATQSSSFAPSMLIGLRGEGDFHHFKPEGSDFSYPQINNWVFYASPKKVNERLNKYIDEGFDLTEEDIDFEDPIEDTQEKNDQKEGE